MGAKLDAEREAHARTHDTLREARITIDRMKLSEAAKDARIAALEEEAEALRDMVATVAAGGARPRL